MYYEMLLILNIINLNLIRNCVFRNIINSINPKENKHFTIINSNNTKYKLLDALIVNYQNLTKNDKQKYFKNCKIKSKKENNYSKLKDSYVINKENKSCDYGFKKIGKLCIKL